MDPCDDVCFQYNIVTLLNSYKGREALKEALEGKAGFVLPEVTVLAELSWDVFVLRFYGPVNPMGSCRARSVYLTTRLLGRLSPLSG